MSKQNRLCTHRHFVPSQLSLRETMSQTNRVFQTLALAWALLLSSLCWVPWVKAQPIPQTDTDAKGIGNIQRLEAGKTIERELAGGQVHSYEITLSAEQFLQAAVDQKGIDVSVAISGPDGRRLVEMDSMEKTQGLELVTVLAEVSGAYTLTIKATAQEAEAGRYAVTLEQIRPSNAQDQTRIVAQRVLAEAVRLRREKTETSLRKALEEFHKALLLWRALGDPRREAITLFLSGEVNRWLSETQAALADCGQALVLWRAAGFSAGEAQVLNEMGMVFNDLGQNEKAFQYYSQALAIGEAHEYRREQAATLNNIGRLYSDSGQHAKAIEYYQRCLPLDQATGKRTNEAIVLNNIGIAYAGLGDYKTALNYYDQALSLRRLTRDRRGEALQLQNIGTLWDSLGEKQTALDYYNQALPLMQASGDRRAEARALLNIGKTYNDLKDHERAIDYYRRALPMVRAIGDQQGETVALQHLGTAQSALGEKQKALEYLQESLALSRKIAYEPVEAAVRVQMARVRRDLGNLAEARIDLEAAMEIGESLRAKIPSQYLRASYFATARRRYELYIDLLMAMHRQEPSAGQDIAALEVSERARARSLLDLLGEARADIREGVSAALLERERSLQRQLSTKAQQQIRLLSGKPTVEQAQVAAREIEALMTEYELVEGHIRSTSPRYAALTQPEPLGVRTIQREVLDPQTLLLEYWLGEEGSFLWAVTATSVASFELPKRAQIEDAARRVYRLMSSRPGPGMSDGDYAEAAAGLSRMLLSPVANLLGAKRLLIVPDGALQYISFASLPEPSAADDQRPLLADHEIVSAPSVSVLAVLRRETAGRKRAKGTVAVLADPVFDPGDPRIRHNRAGQTSSSGQGASAAVWERSASNVGMLSSGGVIPRLAFTRREALAILKTAPAGEQMQALDFAASRGTATDPKLGQYRFIHFATHALINSEHPELSGILLSMVNERGEPQDGFLRLHDVYNLNLPADVVVLSACQTALGKEIQGEGLVGLTRGFLYAGAERVVASLWKVDDVATAELMRRFYSGILGTERLRPAAALRAAQLAIFKQKRWKDPYFWAPFLLQGEWK